MTKTNQLKMAVISDVHLGSKRNKASDIIANLSSCLLDPKENKDLDIIFIAGDLFDTLLSLQDDSVTDILLWFGSLFAFCEKHNIVLRVLEGTPSHDRMQSIHLENVAKLRASAVDFKYVKSLNIEYFPQYNINVLYVPDEWDHDPNNTLAEVKGLMAAKGLQQVDFAIMHGNFEYQLPTNIKGIPRHDSTAYSELVKHYIFIGHIHTFSTLGKIIAQGSFDRLSHNEEEPKGYVKAFVDLKTYDKSFFFIENKNARIYKTISVKNMELSDSLDYIRNKVKDYPYNAAIRISAQKSHPIFTNFHEVITMFPTYTWTKHVVEENEDEHAIQQFLEDELDYTPITLHRDNIADLILNRLKGKKDAQTLMHCSELLHKTLQEIKC